MVKRLQVKKFIQKFVKKIRQKNHHRYTYLKESTGKTFSGNLNLSGVTQNQLLARHWGDEKLRIVCTIYFQLDWLKYFFEYRLKSLTSEETPSATQNQPSSQIIRVLGCFAQFCQLVAKCENWTYKVNFLCLKSSESF